MAGVAEGNHRSFAAAFDELGSAREHAALAAELADGVQWSAKTGEERVYRIVAKDASPKRKGKSGRKAA